MKHNTLTRRAVMLGALAAAVVLALPATASAQRGAGARGGGMFNNPGVRMWTLVDQDLDKFTEDLALTEAQSESFNALLKDFREKNEDGLKRYAGFREKMEAARGGGGNREAMRGMMQEYQQLMQSLGPVLEELHTGFSELLDEDQTKKLAELLQPPRRPGG